MTKAWNGDQRPNPRNLGTVMIVLAQSACLDDELVVELDGEQLVARRGLAVIGRSVAPPVRVHQAVTAACGIATGRVIDVDRDIATLTLS